VADQWDRQIERDATAGGSVDRLAKQYSRNQQLGGFDFPRFGRSDGEQGGQGKP
jgi:hypothetical protein